MLQRFASASRPPFWTLAEDRALLEPPSDLDLSPASSDMPAGPPGSFLTGLEVPDRLSIPLRDPSAVVETSLGQPGWLAFAHIEKQEMLGQSGFVKCEKCLD